MSSEHEDSPGGIRAGASGSILADAFSERLAVELGRDARLARRARDMSRADVARELGVTTEFYARIERGQALPGVTRLARLVDMFDLVLDAIIERAAGRPLARVEPPSDPLPVRRVLRRLRRATPSARALVIELHETGVHGAPGGLVRGDPPVDLLVRDGLTVGIGGGSNSGRSRLETHAADACVDGFYQGRAWATIQYPPGHFPSRENLSGTGAAKPITCTYPAAQGTLP
jgi:transcriptional regulator with XRE-family HTH domain